MRVLKRIVWHVSLFVFSIIFFTVFLFPAIVVGVWRRNKKKSSKPKAVFIGVQEIANNIGTLAGLLEENGIYVRRALPKEHKFYGTKPKNKSYFSAKMDVVKDTFFQVRHLPWVLFKSDQAWFIWYTSILPFNLDYILCLIAGVDLVVQHCGSDVRCNHLHDALFRKYTPGIMSGPYVRDRRLDMIRKFYRQSMAECFGKTISIRNQATFQKGQLGHFFFSQQKLIDGPRKPSGKPIIVHAPSDRSIKRTDVVLEAVALLKQKGYDFEFKLLEDMPNTQVIEILREADIAIDQPATWPARFAIEAAAASCAVVSGNHFSFIGRPSCPAIQFPDNATDLACSIERLLTDGSYRSSVMESSWFFWRDNYSPETCFENYLAVWNNTHQKFSALPDQKEVLLSAAQGVFEKLFILFFYFQACRNTK